MGKHNAPRTTNPMLRAVGVTAATAALTLGLTSPALADESQVDELKQLIKCESSGNPRAVNPTRTRPAGAWQITTGTWLGNGGGKYAPTADRATLAQQNAVAIRVSQTQGAGAWECAPAGLSAPFSAADVAAATGVSARAASTSKPAAKRQEARTQVKTKVRAPEVAAQVRVAADESPAPARKRSTPRVSANGNYTVVSGDTLSNIARVTGDTVSDLHERNRDVIGDNANLIFPKQVLDTK